jgi:hypothetical protein
MELDEVVGFWGRRPTRRYTLADIAPLGLDPQSAHLLTEVGLPAFDTGYRKFFPAPMVSLISKQGEAFLVLGSPFREVGMGEIENVITLSLKDYRAYFVSEGFFHIGFKPSVVSLVNRDLLSFLYFQMKFLQLFEAIFLVSTPPSFQETTELCRLMLHDLDRTDRVGLAWDLDHRHFWRKVIYSTEWDIMEKYNDFFDMKDLLPRPPKFVEVDYGGAVVGSGSPWRKS